MVATSNPKARQRANDALAMSFQLTLNTGPVDLTYLNWRIIQSPNHIPMDQSNHIFKMCQSHFKRRAPPKCDVLFKVDSKVEDDHASASQCSPSELLKLECQHRCPFH